MMLSVFDPVMRQKGEQFNWERKRAMAELLAPHRERDRASRSGPGHRRGLRDLLEHHAREARLLRVGNAVQFGVTDEMLFGDLKRSLTLFLRGSAPSLAPPPSAAEEGDRR